MSSQLALNELSDLSKSKRSDIRSFVVSLPFSPSDADPAVLDWGFVSCPVYPDTSSLGPSGDACKSEL